MPIGSQNQSSFKRIYIKALHVRHAQPLYFSSIITDFTDSWTPRWSPTTVYGRMDPVSFYSGTTRELTVGFRVISDNESEAALNMAKIQKLIQWQYPTYATHGGGGLKLLTAPPYFEISFLNILGGGKKLQGYINGALQINPGFQAKDQPQYFSAGNDKLYFSDVNIVLRFQVLHAGLIGNVIKANNVEFTNGNTRDTQYPYGSPVTLPGPNNGSGPEGPTDTAIYLNQSQAEQDAANREANVTNARVADMNRHPQDSPLAICAAMTGPARQACHNLRTGVTLPDRSPGAEYVKANANNLPPQIHPLGTIDTSTELPSGPSADAGPGQKQLPDTDTTPYDDSAYQAAQKRKIDHIFAVKTRQQELENQKIAFCNVNPDNSICNE